MKSKLLHIILAALLLGSFTATAQVHVHGKVFGGGNLANVKGNSTVTINVTAPSSGSNVDGDVYGGGALADVNSDNVTNASSGKTTSVTLTHGKVNDVYGGGLGDETHEAKVHGPVTVNINGGTANNVFGCNNVNGAPQSTVQVNIEGGSITTNVFGGGNLASTPDNVAPVVSINGGEIGHDVYGGGALANVGGTTVNVMAGTIAGDVYGGALGDDTHAAAVNGPVTVNIGSGTEDAGVVTITGGNATIGGSVFGCNNAAGTPKADVTVNIYRTHHETVNNYPDPVPSTPADLNVTNPNAAEYNAKFALTAVYGGGNKASYIPNATTNKITVNIYGCEENTIKTVYGGGNAADVGIMEVFLVNTNLNIYGGRFDRVFGGGNGDGSDDPSSPNYNPGANISGTATTQIKGGVFRQVFGGSNHKGDIGVAALTIEKTSTCPLMLYESFGGANEAVIHGDVTTTLACSDNPIQMHAFYGGSNLADIIDGDVTLNVYGGIYDNVFGGSKGVLDVTAANIQGDVTLNLFGGTMTNAFGGCDANGNITGKITVNMLDQGDCNLTVHNIYGAGRDASYEPAYSVGAGETHLSPVVNLIHGTVSTYQEGNETKGGNVYGGGLGSTATVKANPVVNVGYDASMATSLATILPAITSITEAQVSVEGNVYGGGEEASVLYGTTVTVQKAATTSTLTQVSTAVSGDVYGGGNLANVSGSTTVGVTGGTVTGDVYGGGALANVGGSGVTLAGGTVRTLYGGGMGNFTTAALVNNNAQVTVTSGTINGTEIATNLKGGVFGGCNVKGTVKGGSTVLINGAVGSDGNKRNIYGGGLGENTNVVGDVAVKIGADVFGDVYGGSAKGLVNYEYNNDATPTTSSGDTTGITLNSGVVSGDIYGGGHGLADAEANVGGPVTVNINGGTVNNVFGANNVKGSPKNTVKVNISNNVAQNVYGGGNLATYTYTTGNYPEVNLLAGTVGVNVFGGGLGSSATVTGNPVVNLQGGTVTGKVFGGGSAAPVTGNPKVNALYGSAPIIHGGGLGSTADVTGNPTVVYNQTSGQTLTVTSAFGGGDAAGVTGNTDVQLKAGSLTNAFGGGNVADITGTTNVTLEGATATNIYGGGNEANITSTATVEIQSGSVTGGVYGGCNTKGSVGPVTVSLIGGQVGVNGTPADVYGGGFGGYVNNTNPGTSTTGNVTVTLTGTTVYGDIYGGSAFGSVNSASTDLTTVNIQGDKLYGTVYGGGKGQITPSYSATNKGKTVVNFETSNTNLTGIYGGANTQGTVKGNIEVNIKDNVGADGAPVDIFGGGYGDATETEGHVTVNIGLQDGSITPLIYGDIYGGSALGQVNDDASDKTTVNFLNGTLKQTTVSSVVHGNIYGGGLGENGSTTKGQVNGEVIVNISNTAQTAAQCKIDLREASIFGCNNTSGSPQNNVTVNVYKTAYNFPDYPTGNKYIAQETSTDYAIDQVFGGGNLADYTATTGHKATVNIIGCNNTIRRVFGGGNAADATGVANIVDGGRFDYIFGGGNGEVAPASIGAGGTDLTVHGGYINHLFGGSNQQGTISGPMEVSVDNTAGCGENIHEFFGGSNEVTIGTSGSPINLSTTIACGTKFGDVYGGSNLADIYGDVTLTINGGIIGNVYAGSKGRLADNTVNPAITAKAADIHGKVTLNIYGGAIDNAFGGSNFNGNISGAIKVNMDWSQTTCADTKSIGNIYGGSNLAEYHPTASGNSPEVNIMHGTVTHNVFGGGLGETAIVNTSNPKVTIGDNVSGHTVLVKENVYGGGSLANVLGSTSVTVISGKVTQDVYGGGALANVGGSSVTLSGGEVRTLYGGGMGQLSPAVAAQVNGNAQVTVTSGTISGTVIDNTTSLKGGVFGGCNLSGTVNGGSTVLINGAVGISSNHVNVYGGGLGENTNVTGAATVTVGANVFGDVYGGSAKGLVSGTTTVTQNDGAISGNIYGGGHGLDSKEANVGGAVAVKVKGGSVNNVYGANNVLGAPQSTVQVDIENGTVNTNVYGGGNLAAYTGTPDVNIISGTVTGSVFGGGNQAGVGGGDVTMTGGQVQTGLYGGCNTSGIVSGPINVNVNGGTAQTVFGGGYGKDTKTGDNVTVTVDGGTVTTDVYGGSALGQVNDAASEITKVELKSGTVSGNIYGGGLGQTGSTYVTYGQVNGKTQVVVSGGQAQNVYGCNNTNGAPKGTVSVEISAGQVTNDVFGGGNQAAYTSPNTNTASPVVTIKGTGKVTHDVFGGGNQAEVTGYTLVKLQGGADIGHEVFGGGNNGQVNGKSEVKIEDE